MNVRPGEMDDKDRQRLPSSSGIDALMEMIQGMAPPPSPEILVIQFLDSLTTTKTPDTDD